MVDVETTGFTPDLERIVEVGVVVLDPSGHEVASFCTLVDPGCDPGPTHVHGISSEMLVGAPSFGAIHPYLAELLSGRVVVGHNVDHFDLGFMRAECRRLGGERPGPRVHPLHRHPGGGPTPSGAGGPGPALRVLRPLRPVVGRPPQCPG